VEETNKILLNSQRLPDNVNVTTQVQLGLENSNKPLPLNDIDTTVDQYEQFLKERKESTIYRFYGVVKPVISNPLFNENVKIYENENNEIIAKTILSAGIFEKDGWVGYYNDEPDEDALQFNDNKSALCDFFPFDPGYDRLRMLDSDGKQNYLLKITYPFDSRDDIKLVKNNAGVTIKDGIPIIEKFSIELNGRLYTGFRTAMNHGLSEGDRIQLINFIDLTSPSTLNLTTKFYRVFKLGNVTNNKKLRTFVIDVNPSDINFTKGTSTVKRVVKDKPSQYYVRKFKSLTVDYKDYDLYPAAYGVTYFNDDVAAFNFKTDIDVKNLTDNLGRPISELYLTIVKNDRDSDATSINTQYWNGVINNSNLSSTITTNPDGSTRFWTKISAGYDLENDTEVNYNIRSYKDPNYASSEYFENIDESDTDFDGDIVEYNENTLVERRLENVYHRVNTIYREYLNSIDSNKENKNEGYIYSPFNVLQIREFANYINPVVDLQSIINKYNITSLIEIEELRKAFQIPDYATQISPNVYKWRDLLDIGFVDNSGVGVNYPFESGAHYLYIDKRFYFQRQDPPCEFILISEDITLGASDTGNVQQNKFLTLLNDPTFLKYTFVDGQQINDLVGNTTEGVLNLVNYNGAADLNLEVTLADYIGEYELGKRDVAGGCVDLSFLEENTFDDVC
jgi:hypothetical protein